MLPLSSALLFPVPDSVHAPAVPWRATESMHRLFSSVRPSISHKRVLAYSHHSAVSHSFVFPTAVKYSEFALSTDAIMFFYIVGPARTNGASVWKSLTFSLGLEAPWSRGTLSNVLIFDLTLKKPCRRPPMKATKFKYTRVAIDAISYVKNFRTFFRFSGHFANFSNFSIFRTRSSPAYVA